MGVKILFFSRGTLGQNSMFPEKGGQNSIFFSQCLEKGGSKPRSLPTNFTEGVPPPRVQTSLKLVCMGATDNMLSLVRVMAQPQTVDELLPEPVLTEIPAIV